MTGTRHPDGDHSREYVGHDNIDGGDAINTASRRDKPSNIQHGDLYVCRVYTDESVDPHVYNNVKHVWHKQQGQVICILHYFKDGSYRYVFWLARQVNWYQVTPQRFEGQVQANESHIDRGDDPIPQT